MAIVMRFPQMADDMSQGTIVKWIRKIGDPVNSGDVLAEIETDKATLELEASDSGILLYCTDREKISVDDVMCIIGEEGEDISQLLRESDVSGSTNFKKSGFFDNLSKSFSNFLSDEPKADPAVKRVPKNDFFQGEIRSIRTFIGAKNYELSRKFYQELGFHESEISPDMCYIGIERFGFYLQKYYVKDWVDNSMVFLEVEDVDETYEHLKMLDLPQRYERVRLTPVKEEAWGKECFLHDPSGILWHFGEFY